MAAYKGTLEPGMILIFEEDLRTHINKDLLLKAGSPCILYHATNSILTIRLPNGKLRYVRNIPERMKVIDSEVGKLLYGK
jgi:hypothetical protein